MSYMARAILPEFKAYLRQFQAVLLLGPRRAGKTTFLKHVLKEWTLADLDDPATLLRLEEDPTLFLSTHPEKVWFDEAQRLPKLFTVLRSAIDQKIAPGRFVLSGSASPFLLHRVQETLAGRVGVLHLLPFSFSELHPSSGSSSLLNFLLSASSSRNLFKSLSSLPIKKIKDLNHYWLWGGFPEPALLRGEQAKVRWFRSYLKTYVERDILLQAPRINILRTQKLIQALAYRHGQILNVSDLARDLGVTPNTVQFQLNLLEASFNWYRLPPYFANLTKRLVKSPKSYFLDTGLLHALLNLTRLESLEVHPLVGASWESLVIGQIKSDLERKSFPARLYYWRTQAGAEVDLVLEHEGQLLPIEIKRATAIGRNQLMGIYSFLEDFRRQAPFGVVFYQGNQVDLVDERLILIPVSFCFLRY